MMGEHKGERTPVAWGGGHGQACSQASQGQLQQFQQFPGRIPLPPATHECV